MRLAVCWGECITNSLPPLLLPLSSSFSCAAPHSAHPHEKSRRFAMFACRDRGAVVSAIRQPGWHHITALVEYLVRVDLQILRFKLVFSYTNALSSILMNILELHQFEWLHWITFSCVSVTNIATCFLPSKHGALSKVLSREEVWLLWKNITPLLTLFYLALCESLCNVLKKV